MVRIGIPLLKIELCVQLIFFIGVYGVAGYFSPDEVTIMPCDGSTYNGIMDTKAYFKQGQFIKYLPFYKTIKIENCLLPSFATFFESKGIKAATVKYASIELSMFSISNDVEAETFRGLPLKYLYIHYISQTKPGTPKFGFLKPLTQLEELRIRNAVLPPMPADSVILIAYLDHGRSTGPFGGCEELINLYLISWTLQKDFELTFCYNLVLLYMEEISPKTVTRLLREVEYLEELTVNSCNLINLPADIFDKMKNLKSLNLGNNQLKDISFNAFLPSLVTLSLYKNFLYEASTNPLHKLPALKELDVGNNLLFNICQTYFAEDSTVYPKLKKLDLSNTLTNLDCIDVRKVPALKELHLHNFLGWPVNLLINIKQNNINNIHFTQADYETLHKTKPKISISGNIKVKCDCHHAYFAQSLRENLLKWKDSDVICEDMEGMSLKRTLRKQTECNRSLCGDCVCRRMWWSNVTEADCRGAAATRIPQVEGLQTLLAPDNRIQLRSEDIPDTLIHLDLTKNKIISIDKAVTRKLFSVKNRTILLGGNQFLCDCENKDFIQALQINHEQVPDYASLTCYGEAKEVKTKYLRNVTVSEFVCIVLDSTPFKLSLAAVGILLVLIVIAVFANYYYGQEIRVFLYARGWCLFCVKETNDSDQDYDAFVSFCHEDETLVTLELVPQLEKLGYKICIHYRDWAPGELIPTQIVRSVEVSRRTIIVLSKNFIHSLWGSLEFKTAHARALKEGVARVIVIVLDDVIDSENLDGDLRSYIRTNTYVKWNDPWIWDKLHYAMRRRQGLRNRGEPKTCNVDTSVNNGSTESDRVTANIADTPVIEYVVDTPVMPSIAFNETDQTYSHVVHII